MADRRGKSREPRKRQLRVGEQLRHALAEILSRDLVRDPAVAGVSITVTEVDVSPDLRQAVAYVTPLGGAGHEAVLAGLNRSARFLRGEVTRRVALKYSPEIRFRFDTSFDHASRIERLLKGSDAKPARRDRPAAPADDRDGA